MPIVSLVFRSFYFYAEFLFIAGFMLITSEYGRLFILGLLSSLFNMCSTVVLFSFFMFAINMDPN
jgi:hypothetical protein